MRERKRQARHDAIIDAASRLFQQKGYEQTTMEEVAAAADVSAPTLYRYFPRKSELMIGFFWKEREILAGALDDFHKRSVTMDAVSAVSGLLLLNNSGVGTKARRRIWREAMAALLRMHDTPDDAFRAIKRYFEKRIERMLERLHGDGRLRKDAPISTLVSVLYAVAAENYYRVLASEFRNAAEEKAAMEEQVGAILKGWLAKG